MTTRRAQDTGENEGSSGLPADIDALLEKQIKAEQTRKAYQQRPDVQEKRKEYQSKQNDQRKIARAAMKGDTAALSAMGYDEATATGLIERAKQLAS